MNWNIMLKQIGRKMKVKILTNKKSWRCQSSNRAVSCQDSSRVPFSPKLSQRSNSMTPFWAPWKTRSSQLPHQQCSQRCRLQQTQNVYPQIQTRIYRNSNIHLIKDLKWTKRRPSLRRSSHRLPHRSTRKAQEWPSQKPQSFQLNVIEKSSRKDS